MTAEVRQIYGAMRHGCETPISAERQQLIDDLERLIGDIKSGEIVIHDDRVMLCYEEEEPDGRRYPKGYRAGGMRHAFTLLEATGLLRWIAQVIQDNQTSDQ